MTEEEAKAKWCPFVRFTDQGNNRSDNVGGSSTDMTTCIGSACMAWRWGEAETFKSRAGAVEAGAQRRDTWPDIAEFGEPDDLLRRHGYCGLAGKP